MMIAGLIAVVPRFVLDRVVEHPGFAYAPFARLAADAKAAAWRDDQRQMDESRKFATPVCGGMRVCGCKTENSAEGERSGTRACGSAVTAAIVAGARATRSSTGAP